MTKTFTIIFFAAVALISCNSQTEDIRVYPEDTSSIKMLESIAPEHSGINFSNNIIEDPLTNVLTYDGMLQGAGVAVLDANNDGLLDIYFASNMESDKLYLNKGDFKFEDATEKCGISKGYWSTGVSIVDINGDGFDDIYVCKFLYDSPEKLHNVFYINNGDGTYIDRAKEMGLDDNGYGIMANFLDYDNDGDLDMYLANQPPNSLLGKDILKGKINYKYTDKLFRNDNGTFTDVTQSSGITNYSYSLSATAFDFNQDGWTDIYVACDYDEPDYIYKNNGNGTFTNVADQSLKHMSNFSMGVDIADINNDGFLDVYVVDMVAEDNYRQKTNMGGMDPAKFYGLAATGYHYQYMYNSMQLNNGDETFSEIAQLAGISNTDWSWSPLFIDLDQDGYKDLLVTNGLIKEMRNKDFQIWRKQFFADKMKEADQSGKKDLYVNPMEISEQAPSQKIANFVYRNEGNLTFSKQNSAWGFDEPTWSQGAAYGDFDNDGDMDVVVSNMGMTSGLYKNIANDKKLNNFIAIKLNGSKLNIKGINARIDIVYGDEKQSLEMSTVRGYMSSSQAMVHFGLGKNQSVKSISVSWPDNRSSYLTDVAANQILTIKHSESSGKNEKSVRSKSIFTEVPDIDFKHQENNFDDYKREILLPYKTSTLGPVMAKGDVNNDGLEDLFLGGSAGTKSQLLINNGKGGFVSIETFPEMDAGFEDGGALFFDFDNDKDLDLYVCSGGSEYKNGTNGYRDRLYVNQGDGTFVKSNLIPEYNVSTAAVAAFDYDGDGDLDLFVGGRQSPGAYGRPVSSFLYENSNGRYIDVSQVKAPFLKDFGMVTDAKIGDLNNDGKVELVVVGEWMAVKVFEISKSGLKDVSRDYSLENTKGWWNVVELADVDGDKDLDIIGGNLGLNIKYKASVAKPFKLFVDDFDKNGSNDVYLGYYEGEKCFPVRGKQCSTEQMPFVSDKFKSYSDFGAATITDVLDGLITDKTVLQEAQTFANSVFINDGGKFIQVEFPSEAQISPVYAIAVDDFNQDGIVDVFLGGNMYNREVETTRSDAGKGCLISVQTDGSIEVSRNISTGISADRDVRSVALLKSKEQSLLVIANNNDFLQVYQY